MTDSFADDLWRGITGIYAAILEHPFVTGLADGSLPSESFEFYVVQDALYLRKYARGAGSGRPAGRLSPERPDVRPARLGHRRCREWPARVTAG